MKRATREWVKKADEDFRGAGRLASGPDPLHNLVGFCCQQAAEKYLKPLIEELGHTIPKTHALERLLDLVIPHHPTLRLYRRGLRFLTKFAVETRYPGDDPTKRQAAAAQRWAGRVRGACRALLGLRPPRRRHP
jgi:HEPN domain-containing protein